MNYKIIVLCVACLVAGRFGIPAYKFIMAKVQGQKVASITGKGDSNIGIAEMDESNDGTAERPKKPAESKESAGKTILAVNEQPEPAAPIVTKPTNETGAEEKETSLATNEATNDKTDKTTQPQVESKPAITPPKVTTVNAAPKSAPTTVTTGDTTSENPMIKVLEKLEGKKK